MGKPGQAGKPDVLTRAVQIGVVDRFSPFRPFGRFRVNQKVTAEFLRIQLQPPVAQMILPTNDFAVSSPGKTIVGQASGR
jgi:hypothetical protein